VETVSVSFLDRNLPTGYDRRILNTVKITYTQIFNINTGVAAPDAPIQAWETAARPLKTSPIGCDLH